MEISRREKLDARLPATPCTQDMRALMLGVAKKEGVSLADVQRTAFDLFLSHYDSNAINIDK